VLKLILLIRINRLSKFEIFNFFFDYIQFIFSPNRDDEPKIDFQREPLPGQGPQTGGLH
jgi:hypothetical protein